MEAQVHWHQRLAFTGKAGSGFEVPLDSTPDVGGDDSGFRPTELVLIGLAGCTAMDVISILQKKRQEVTDFDVKTYADRSTEHPKVFTHITIEYTVTGRNIDPAAVERAVQLSSERYCTVSAMLAKAAPIEHKIVIKEAV